jgi:sugar phosphate isomerase/epimerase
MSERPVGGRNRALTAARTVKKKPARLPSKKPWADRGLGVFVALPFRLVRRNISFLRKNGLGVEIVLYDTNWICSYPADKVAELAGRLRDAEVEVTVHGPIFDLNPGSLDVVVRDYTRHCYFKTLAICHALGATALVFHLGLNPLLPESALDGWLEGSIRAWEPIVDMAEQLRMTIRLENMFAPSPRFIVALKNGLKSNAIKVCFDVAHFNVYSKTPLINWLDEIGPELDEVHLNDNMGTEDEHLELGKGIIDFRNFFGELASRGINPQFTIEMSSDKFAGILNYLAKNDLLAPFARH